MKRLGNLFFLAGCLLILGSFGLFAASQLQANRAADTAAELAVQLDALLPPRTSGIAGSYTNTEMPALELSGQDFIGILEIPAFQRALPIGKNWDARKTDEFPRRFWGSAYDNSLILGGSNQKGQFDFISQIQNGDHVFVTDMTGTQFSYVVENIHRSKSAQADVLLDESAALTLFARETNSLDYIIVRCIAG